jgi:hypothetical protein
MSPAFRSQVYNSKTGKFPEGSTTIAMAELDAAETKATSATDPHRPDVNRGCPSAQANHNGAPRATVLEQTFKFFGCIGIMVSAGVRLYEAIRDGVDGTS